MGDVEDIEGEEDKQMTAEEGIKAADTGVLYGPENMEKIEEEHTGYDQEEAQRPHAKAPPPFSQARPKSRSTSLRTFLSEVGAPTASGRGQEFAHIGRQVMKKWKRKRLLRRPMQWISYTWRREWTFDATRGCEQTCKRTRKARLGGLDGKTGGVTAHRVDHKGSDDGYPVRLVTTDLLEAGYACEPVVLTIDQELAITDLQSKVCEKRSSRTIPVNTQFRASRSNGSVENAAKRVAEQVRVMKDPIDTKFGVRVETSHQYATGWLSGQQEF